MEINYLPESNSSPINSASVVSQSVIIPNQNYVGISKKISDKYERRRLRKMIALVADACPRGVIKMAGSAACFIAMERPGKNAVVLRALDGIASHGRHDAEMMFGLLNDL